MSTQDELSKLIAAAESEVEAGKKERHGSLKSIMKGEAVAESKTEKPEPKSSRSSDDSWDNWKIGQDPDETDEAKKRKNLITVGVFAFVFIILLIAMQFYMQSVEEQKKHKAVSNLPLSSVKVGDRVEKKPISKDFSGVRDGKLYHNGQPSAVRPESFSGKPVASSVIETRMKEKKEKMERNAATPDAKPRSISGEADDKSIRDIPPDAPEHIKEHYRNKAAGKSKPQETPADSNPSVLVW